MLTDADRARVLAALAAVDRAHAAEARAMETIRATLTGPPAEMRLPGGGVAYQTIRAGEVVPGMWVQAGGHWKQVVHHGRNPNLPGRVRFTFDTDPDYSFRLDEKVRVASTVDGARMAAERQAQQAEAYDHACEAR